MNSKLAWIPLQFCTLIFFNAAYAIEITRPYKKPRLHAQERERKELCHDFIPKNPSTVNYYNTWAKAIQESAKPSWLPNPIAYLIAEYTPSFTWRCTSEVHIPPSTACAYIPKSEYGPLIAVSTPNIFTIRLLKSNDGSEIAIIGGHNESVTQLTYSPISNILISKTHNTMRSWEIQTDQVEKSKHLKTLQTECSRRELSPHADFYAIIIDACYDIDTYINYVEISPLAADGQEYTHHFPNYKIKHMAWHHDNKTLLMYGKMTNSEEEQTILFDTHTKTIVRSFAKKLDHMLSSTKNGCFAYLSHYEHMYWFDDDQDCDGTPISTLLVLSAINGETIKKMTLKIPKIYEISKSPFDGFIALLGLSQLRILDTRTHEINTPQVTLSKIKKPLFFISEGCFITAGKTSEACSYIYGVNFISYVPEWGEVGIRNAKP